MAQAAPADSRYLAISNASGAWWNPSASGERSPTVRAVAATFAPVAKDDALGTPRQPLRHGGHSGGHIPRAATRKIFAPRFIDRQGPYRVAASGSYVLRQPEPAPPRDILCEHHKALVLPPFGDKNGSLGCHGVRRLREGWIRSPAHGRVLRVPRLRPPSRGRLSAGHAPLARSSGSRSVRPTLRDPRQPAMPRPDDRKTAPVERVLAATVLFRALA
jgi:hypothetical protein